MSESPKPRRPDFDGFEGAWTGTWKTWLEADRLLDESPIRLTAKLLIGGRDLLVAYNASIEGDDVEGHLFAGPLQAGGVHAAWTDSWHTAGLVQAGSGDVTDDGFTTIVPYTYEDQVWTWSSEYAAQDGRLVIRHHNEGPGYPRYLGVEAILTRVEGT